MLTEKEKLEEELKLLEESFSLDVITQEEFEYAKQRVEAKLNRLDGLEQKEEESEKESKEELGEEPKPEGETEEEPEANEYEAKEEAEEEKSEEETYIEKEELTEKPEEEEREEDEQKKLEETEAEEEKPAGEVEEEEKIEEKQPEIIFEKEKKSSKKIWAYIAIILILGFGLWYFFLPGSSNAEDVSKPVYKPVNLIACSSDDECIKEGSIGICNNPGEENAECKYIEDVKIKLTILNSDNCFNCETGRVLSIIHSFFPNLDTENVDFETDAGKEIAEKFNIAALPAYILNSSLQESKNYYKLYNAFTKVDDSFVMKNTVANANYYIGREEMPNKLDLFLIPSENASFAAEKNLKEFLEAFDEKVDFEKHNSDDEIVKELGINTFPTFLVNNKIKFSGVQSANKIKENFCSMNKLDECELGLTKKLV